MKSKSEQANPDLEKRVQRMVRNLKKSSPTDTKANAGLALAIIALVSGEKADSTAQQLLKLLKDLEK